MGGRKRVAIVGAGLSGLAAIKSCLEEGMEPVCFEQYDDIGGVWYYTKEYREGQGARAFDYLNTNVSREMYGFSDFPYPSNLPPFLNRTMVYDYVQSYCETFGLRKHIHLRTRIVNIKKAADYNVTGRWQVETMDAQKKTKTEIYDFVMICSGFYKKPRIPPIEGMETFKGTLEHTYKFRDGLPYKDKNVLVIGNSHSSGDVSVESSCYAKQVYYSVGDGMLLLPLCVRNGQPWDIAVFRRSKMWNPTKFFKLLVDTCNERLDHNKAGIAPSTPPSRTRVMLNDRVQYKIMNGRIKVVSRLIRLGPHEAEFDDGTVLKNLDAVLFATGYDFSVDFMDEPFQGKDRKLGLYKMMFPLHQHHTLSVVGCVDSDGSIPALAELQGRFVALVYTGKLRLPSLKVMTEVTEKMNADIFEKYGRYKYLVSKTPGKCTTNPLSYRTTLFLIQSMHDFLSIQRKHLRQIPNLPYRDDIAKQMGVAPSLFDLIKAGPRLAYQYYYGPAFPYHHRLWGPHSWSGAREAIDNATEHGHYGKQMRHVQGPDIPATNRFLRFIIVSAMIAMLALAYQKRECFWLSG
ncbi:flavin-containing monooxygenase 5-like [Haliotis rubra]|uniref:flavin-containing monooxygenase 5-like n=1 Tax=Haliotis rubra TaxID=36100 RepID=UPI001EE5C3F0|nr:flavin-containing monooxygenase 5-like [Haliotis rubra]